MAEMRLPKVPFYFLRHGQTDWNAEGRLQGWTDIPLNSTGLRQREVAADILQNQGIVAVITSPLQRAHETGKYVAARLGVPLHVDVRWKERGFGSFEGAQTDKLCRDLNMPRGASLIDYLPPDAENNDDIRQRVYSALYDALGQYDGPVLISSHGSVYRTVNWHLRGSDMITSKNAVPHRFRPGQPWWTVEEVKR